MVGVARFLTAMGGPDDDADNVQGKWIGLGIVIGSAVLSNLGVNVQKLSHVREDEKPLFERRTYYTRPVWLIGMVLIVLGAIGDFEALGFAPQALVAAVGGGFTVLANVFFAHLWLGQILTKTDVLGTLLIIIGVVLSTVANEPDEKMSLLELEKQFFQLGFLIYLASCTSRLLLQQTAVLGGIFGQVEAISRLPRALNESKYRLLPFLYATASGIFGSFSVLLAKCASILLILTLSGENQFVYFTTYLFMGGMMCTLCFWIGSSVIGGVVFYEKYTHFTLFDWICLPIALAFIIMGIYLLAKHGESDSDDPNDPEHNTPGHRAHLTGHFGALMPLSPQGHSYSGFSRKSFDDRENETTPLRYTPTNGRVGDHSGLTTGYTNGHTNGHDHGQRNGHPVGHWQGSNGRRHHGDDLEEQRLYSGSI
ncbi:hypothetical protein KRP22_006918 [Phytophthora ramorum]|nr:putative magnesium transporter NIPA8 [Phytophthora ramorum]